MDSEHNLCEKQVLLLVLSTMFYRFVSEIYFVSVQLTYVAQTPVFLKLFLATSDSFNP